jgi:hypothetical protein
VNPMLVPGEGHLDRNGVSTVCETGERGPPRPVTWDGTHGALIRTECTVCRGSARDPLVDRIVSDSTILTTGDVTGALADSSFGFLAIGPR